MSTYICDKALKGKVDPRCPPTRPLLPFFLKFILFIYLSIYLFIYLWLCWVFIAVVGLHHGLSLVAASGGYSFVVVRGLLIAVASLVAEHGL